MKLELHPNAKTNFNNKIEELKTRLRFKVETKHIRKPKMNSNIHVSGHFDETKIIGDIKLSLTDTDGNTSARMFNVRHKEIGLYGEDYKELQRVAENIQKSTNPKNVVSVNFLCKHIFEWIEQNYFGKIKESPIDFILSECEKSIVEAEIWIPIAELHIQTPFNLGKVTFKTITKEVMDLNENIMLSKVTKPNEIENVKLFFNRKRSNIQNRVASIVKVEAEPEWAYQIAYEETEKALNVLRFYAPTNLNPRKTCYVAPIKKQHMDSNVYMVVKNEEFLTEFSGQSDKSANPWFLSKADLVEYHTIGFGFLSSILTEDNLTDFQKKLLEALSLYSKAALSKEISDRLVYTLVTLETIFVKDRQEPLQDNISLRMAQMHPVSVAERREIIKNIKDTYALRSSFIHHGANIGVDDLDVLRKFMNNTWLSLIEVINYASKGITIAEFFEDLENRRVGG